MGLLGGRPRRPAVWFLPGFADSGTGLGSGGWARGLSSARRESDVQPPTAPRPALTPRPDKVQFGGSMKDGRAVAAAGKASIQPASGPLDEATARWYVR